MEIKGGKRTTHSGFIFGIKKYFGWPILDGLGYVQLSVNTHIDYWSDQTMIISCPCECPPKPGPVPTEIEESPKTVSTNLYSPECEVSIFNTISV